MDNVSKKMKTEDQKEMLGKKILSMGLLGDWTQPRKQSVGLKIYPKLKWKENNVFNLEQNIFELWYNYKRNNIIVIEISEQAGYKKNLHLWIFKTTEN